MTKAQKTNFARLLINSVEFLKMLASDKTASTETIINACNCVHYWYECYKGNEKTSVSSELAQETEINNALHLRYIGTIIELSDIAKAINANARRN